MGPLLPQRAVIGTLLFLGTFYTTSVFFEMKRFAFDDRLASITESYPSKAEVDVTVTVTRSSNATNRKNRDAEISGNHHQPIETNTSTIEPSSSSSTNTNTNTNTNTSTAKKEFFFPIRKKMIENNEMIDDHDHDENQIPPITFLVILSGEFANNMDKSIFGWAVAKMAYEEFGIRSRLVFSRQRNKRKKVIGKARKTSRELAECVPFFDDVDFSIGNVLLDADYFVEFMPNTMSKDRSHKYWSKFDRNITSFRESIRSVVENLKQNLHLFQNNNSNNNNNNNNNSPELNDELSKFEGIVPRVMLRINSLNIKVPLDLYYDEIFETFAFDDAICCGETLDNPPEADESVLHYRNFGTELRKVSLKEAMGFMEMTGDHMVSRVLGHLNPGDKLAVTGRNLMRDSMENRTDAHELFEGFRRGGLTVRVSPGTTGPEDFCFLKMAKKELIGVAKSTYVHLASVLGGPSIQTTRLYSYLPSDGSGFRFGPEQFDFAHPQLASRIHHDVYIYNRSDLT